MVGSPKRCGFSGKLAFVFAAKYRPAALENSAALM